MQTGTIILLNGPSCSGKTSTARAIQEAMPEPYLHVGLDHFEAMQPCQRGRRIHVFYGEGIAAPDLVPVMHQCIAAFASARANVIVEHILLERAWLRDVVAQLSAHRVLFVGVHCRVEELDRRKQEREGTTPSSGQARRQFGQLAYLTVYDPYELVVDTSLSGPEECAAQVRHHLEGKMLRSAFSRLKASCVLSQTNRIP
jgi:chloramphenicol 3-O phosphotransferase